MESIHLDLPIDLRPYVALTTNCGQIIIGLPTIALTINC